MARKPQNNQLDKLMRTKKFKQSLEFSMFQTRISQHVYEKRKELGLSQKELAKMAGTTQRIISEVETGNYKTAEMLYRLFRALDKDLVSDGEDLITGQEVNNPFDIFFVNSSGDIKYDEAQSGASTCKDGVSSADDYTDTDLESPNKYALASLL